MKYHYGWMQSNRNFPTILKGSLQPPLPVSSLSLIYIFSLSALLQDIVRLSSFQEMDWDQLDMNPRVIAAIKKGNLLYFNKIMKR